MDIFKTTTTDCFFHGNFHRFSHVNHGPLWAARSRIEHFEAPGAGNSGSYSGSRHRLSWRDFFPFDELFPLIGKLTMIKQLSLVSMIYLYISISYLFICFSSFLVVETPKFRQFSRPPFHWRFLSSLKLGDFVVGSQELLVACGLDHVVVVRNLLQLGLAARNHGRW